jgi:hypothetical protein
MSGVHKGDHTKIMEKDNDKEVHARMVMKEYV